MQYQNPIIRGFNPDPSICRVGEDFYLVTSTFEFFPGVPIYHSKNLVNWELIGHCLNDEAHVPLRGCRFSGGIYAPTIRYHDGIYYMITTNVTDKGNFIVYTDDIRGEWSEPKWIEHKGIDPDLFFDDDGKVYFTGTGGKGETYGIYAFEINPKTGEALSEVRLISKGFGGINEEGPHLYKVDGVYYLMMAEGGTEFGHNETIFRGPSPYGPWESCPHNPILNHRDAMFSLIQCAGHADLVEDQNGSWWMVSLGVRPLFNYGRRQRLHNLGRETFLSPVTWKDGWPVVGEKGRHEFVTDAPLPGPAPEPVCRDVFDDFDGERLNREFSYIRNPYAERYKPNAANSGLILLGSELDLSTPDDSPTFMGVRQVEFEMSLTTKLSERFTADEQQAGVAAYYSDCYHYEMYLTKEEGDYFVCLNRKIHDLEAVTACHKIDYVDSIEFKLAADRHNYKFYYRTKDGEFTLLGQGMVAGLCTQQTYNMSFTGNFLGIFAVGGNAEFDWFKTEILPDSGQ